MQSDPDNYPSHRPPNTPEYRLDGHYIISDQVSAGDIRLVCDELRAVLAAGVPGAVVEFGCYVGTTSQFIRRVLDENRSRSPGDSKREFHVYDSFEGLPAKRAEDQSAAGVEFAAGKLSVSKKEFLAQFRAAGLAPPIAHKGWFSQLTRADVPDKIAFAFLDGDFYESILDSLRLVWPRLSPGARILIDDYARPELPGVERAVRDFFGGQVPKLRVTRNIAIIRPA